MYTIYWPSEVYCIFQKAYNDSASGRVRKGCIDQLRFKQSVEVEESTSYTFEENLGVWWPVSLYEATFKKRANPEKLVNVALDGKQKKGIVLDTVHGSPVGTVKMGKQWERKAKKSGTVVAADKVFRKGQVEDAV